jgi:hypothetical protein
MKADKWAMFKQYMHNELNITKEDIKEWIMEAVQEESRKIVENTFGKFTEAVLIRRVIQAFFTDQEYISFKERIKQEVAGQIIKNIDIKIKL